MINFTVQHVNISVHYTGEAQTQMPSKLVLKPKGRRVISQVLLCYHFEIKTILVPNSCN